MTGRDLNLSCPFIWVISSIPFIRGISMSDTTMS